MNILVLGATGTIGNYIYNSFKKYSSNVYGTSSRLNEFIYVDNNTLDNLNTLPPLDVVVWCQGYNVNDTIYNFKEDEFMKTMIANVLFILKTLNYLVNNNKIRDNGKLVIISSIWEEFTRDNKLSYSISKSALQGLVKNAAYDLSSKNILINNVLPGVINSDMSRKTLDPHQINYVKNYLHFNRLIDLEDVFNTVKFLTFENTGITGQSIKVDLGFTHIKKYE